MGFCFAQNADTACPWRISEAEQPITAVCITTGTRRNACNYDDLYGVVLERIQSTAKLFQDDSSFLGKVSRRAGQDASKRQAAQTQAKLEKRQSELARLLRKLFEDNAAGLVNDENYAVMFKAYQDEQAEAMEKLRNIQVELAKEDNYRVNAEKLREVIRDYLDIQELTPFILNKLVERIDVGYTEMVNGQAQQEVAIVWKFVGKV